MYDGAKSVLIKPIYNLKTKHDHVNNDLLLGLALS